MINEKDDEIVRCLYLLLALPLALELGFEVFTFVTWKLGSIRALWTF
jgi:hypothetical protein